MESVIVSFQSVPHSGVGPIVGLVVMVGDGVAGVGASVGWGTGKAVGKGVCVGASVGWGTGKAVGVEVGVALGGGDTVGLAEGKGVAQMAEE